MKKSRPLIIAAAALMVLSSAGVVQSISPEDLAGSYAVDVALETMWGEGGPSFHILGVITLNPDGTLEGRRYSYQIKRCPGPDSNGVLEPIEQRLVGRWTVDEDGMGLMTYTVSPAPIVDVLCDHLLRHEHDPNETMRFVAAEDGCRLPLHLNGRVYHLDLDNERMLSDGEPVRTNVDFAGIAIRQDERCAGGSRPMIFSARPAVPAVTESGPAGLR